LAGRRILFEHTRLTDWRYVRFFAEGSSRHAAAGGTTSSAVYASATYNILDNLKITAGVRYSRDKKDIVVTPTGRASSTGPYTINGVAAPGNTFTARGSKSWSATTPAFTINYQPTERVFLYGTYSEGFRSGGFNDTPNEKVDGETPFDPEFVKNVELGAKTEWFGRRLRANVALFNMDYDDQQIVVPVANTQPQIFITGNVGKSWVRGIEFETEAAPIPGLYINLSYSYMDSELKDLPIFNAMGVLTSNFAGNQMARVPHDKYFASVSYDIQARDFIVTPRVAYNKTSEQFTGVNNDLFELIPAQDNLDASISFKRADGPWEIELWGKNLDDNLNITGIFAFFGTSYAHMGTPTTYGLSFRVKN
jgi:iron complex outermembrane receptor protein